MAKHEIERTVQPSVLDRLTDEDPRSPADQRVSYAESVKHFKASVQRDLEWLLNSRRQRCVHASSCASPMKRTCW